MEKKFLRYFGLTTILLTLFVSCGLKSEKGKYKIRIKAIDTAGNEAISKEYEMIVS